MNWIAKLFKKSNAEKVEDTESNESEWQAVDLNLGLSRPKNTAIYTRGADISVAGFNQRIDVWNVLSSVKSEKNVMMYFEIQREPDNKFDKNALKVVVRRETPKKEFHLGYVPKEIAAGIAKEFKPEMPIVFEPLRIGQHKQNGARFLAINIIIPNKKTREEHNLNL